MIINRQVLSNKIVSFLNGEVSLAQIVDWAENTFVAEDDFEPEEDTDLLVGILMDLAAGDTPITQLTWDLLIAHLHTLGMQVVIQATAPSMAGADTAVPQAV